MSAFGFISRAACPACGSPDSEARYRCGFNEQPIKGIIESFYKRPAHPWAAGEYRIEQCRSCGTYWQAEIGDDAALGELYEHWATGGEPTDGYDVLNPAKSRDGHEVMTVASYFGKPIQSLKLLDYGMGWASWARIAQRLGASVFGFDLSADRMEYARKHGIRISSADGFDFINTEQTMEHVADPGEMVGKLARLLRPGGILKVSVPSVHGVETLLADTSKATIATIMPVHPLEHINTFTRAGIHRLGARFGLTPAKSSLIDRYAFLRHRGSLDTRQPRLFVKELVRPIAPTPRNLYVWLQRPIG